MSSFGQKVTTRNFDEFAAFMSDRLPSGKLRDWWLEEATFKKWKGKRGKGKKKGITKRKSKKRKSRK